MIFLPLLLLLAVGVIVDRLPIREYEPPYAARTPRPNVRLVRGPYDQDREIA